jgi:hypothetical protein
MVWRGACIVGKEKFKFKKKWETNFLKTLQTTAYFSTI